MAFKRCSVGFGFGWPPFKLRRFDKSIKVNFYKILFSNCFRDKLQDNQ